MKINFSYNRLIKVTKHESNSIIEVPDKCTVRDLFTLLEIPNILQQSIVVHINNEPAWNSTILKENDSVTLIPMIGAG